MYYDRRECACARRTRERWNRSKKPDPTAEISRSADFPIARAECAPDIQNQMLPTPIVSFHVVIKLASHQAWRPM
jgi:hypothetical protein